MKTDKIISSKTCCQKTVMASTDQNQTMVVEMYVMCWYLNAGNGMHGNANVYTEYTFDMEYDENSMKGGIPTLYIKKINFLHVN